ncbi:MAG: leucine-rich repeat domain-containing protein, partial [Alistipes sp.]|nr:leucine-rich repeat domain-containing protein [Alistipes sp.]
TKLTELRCSENQLTALDVSKKTKLTDLWCHNNQLTSLDVSKNTELTTLNCYVNKLTALDVSNNTKLIQLWCSSNQLTTLDVSKTNLVNNSISNYCLHCRMASLQTLYLKTGWQLEGINKNRDENYIHPNTRIKYKD